MPEIRHCKRETIETLARAHRLLCVAKGAGLITAHAHVNTEDKSLHGTLIEV